MCFLIFHGTVPSTIVYLRDLLCRRGDEGHHRFALISPRVDQRFLRHVSFFTLRAGVVMPQLMCVEISRASVTRGKEKA